MSKTTLRLLSLLLHYLVVKISLLERDFAKLLSRGVDSRQLLLLKDIIQVHLLLIIVTTLNHEVVALLASIWWRYSLVVHVKVH